MNRASTLEQAAQAVLRDRNKEYGEPEDLYQPVAAKWSATLGAPVSPAQVILCLIDLKTCRLAHNITHADSWIDVAGYAACGAEVATADAPDPCDCMGNLE